MNDPAGLILDTSALIHLERHRLSLVDALSELEARYPASSIGISTISAVELTHGITRASVESHRLRRQAFADTVFHSLIVYPVTLQIARLAGTVEGEQRSQGVTIELEDLLIGATALHLNFSVLTLNTRHFTLIPGIQVIPWPTISPP